MPKTSNALLAMKWSKSLTNFLCWVVGTRMIPLTHVGEKNVVPVRPMSPLAQDSPHSEDHSSVEEEMVEFASCAHWLLKSDSPSACYHLEKSEHSASRASSTKPHQRKKDD